MRVIDKDMKIGHAFSGSEQKNPKAIFSLPWHCCTEEL